MAILYPYHPKLMALLSAPPPIGGGHRWLFKAALHLRHYHKAEVVTRILREYTLTWERMVPDLEITKTVRKAFDCPSGGPGGVSEDWPEPKLDAIAAITGRTAPLPLKDFGRSAIECLEELWGPDALLCCGPSQDSAKVKKCSEWLSLNPETLQFIVPNAMRAPWGVTADGRESQRCLANTGPRQYLVVECDAASEDQQARILAHIGQVLPLRMVVHSGGKSLHGWFAVGAVPEAILAKVFGVAVLLGADSHTWARCQWVRMPGGTRTRDDGSTARQAVLYWRKGEE